MLTSSKKQKGRSLCKIVQRRLLDTFTSLTLEDIRVTSSGAQGEDLQLSPRAREVIPISIECKNLKQIAVYKFFKQAKQNANGHEPVVVIKQNHSDPLVLIDLEYFIKLIGY